MPGKKLLVADDSLTIQKVIRLALSNEGYEIQTVSDGDDAVQQISLFRPDIVLIDVSLPGQTAFDVKRAVNAHEDLRNVRFVLMSSAFERIDEKQLASLVFDGRLTKPFDPAHLRQVLSGVLSKAPTQGTGLTPTAPIPTALVTPPPAQGAPFSIPPRPGPAAAPQAPAFAPPPPPPPPPQAPEMPDFPPPEAPSQEEFTAPSENPDEGPTAPPPGLIAEEDNYGPKYIPTPPSPQEEVTQPFLNPFQNARQPNPPAMTPQKSDSLWDDHDSTFDAPPAPPPAPPPPQAAPRPPQAPAAAAQPETASGDDIRHLTESTIRMSGLDDFEWSVSEPSLKPHGTFGEEAESNFPMNDEAGAEAASVPDANDFADEEEATEFISAPGGVGGLPPITTGSFSPPPPPARQAAGRPARPTAAPAPPIAPPPAPPAAMRAAAAAPSIDSAEIERIVRTQVQETLEKIAQKILPEVAEKVIKQEIHRMLSELP